MKNILIIILLLSLQACSSTFVKPEVSLVDLQPGEATIFETKLSTKIRITNPNKKDLRITGSRHKIYVNGVNIGTAVSNKKTIVPGLSDATETLSVRLSNFILFSRFEKIINSKNFKYQIDSTFFTDKFMGLGSISTSEKGEF